MRSVGTVFASSCCMVNPLDLVAASREAALVTEGNRGRLCQLATIDAEGCPRVRTIIAHDVTKTFVSCIYSRFHQKALQLELGKFQVYVWHPAQGNQFLINGHIEPMPEQRLQRYWDEFLQTGAKCLDKFYETEVAHQPGMPFASRAELESKFSKFKKELIDKESPLLLPGHVIGAHFVAERVEHLHVTDSDGRFHERTVYSLDKGKWDATVVVP